MGTATTKPYRVLVGFDFSQLGVLALSGGIRQVAAMANGELHVVGVVSRGGLGPFDRKADAAQLDRIRAEIERYIAEAKQGTKLDTIPTHAHARIGNPSVEISSLADEQDIDLIVVGTHGRHGVKRLVHGSVAEHVVRDAPCPVLVMRPKTTSAAQFAPEPPCPHCVAAREASNGAQMWCEVHAEASADTHVGGPKRHSGSGAWTLYNH